MAVAAGLGAATGVAHAVPSGVAWLLAPLAATTAYLLGVALQVSAVAALGRRRS